MEDETPCHSMLFEVMECSALRWCKGAADSMTIPHQEYPAGSATATAWTAGSARQRAAPHAAALSAAVSCQLLQRCSLG